MYSIKIHVSAWSHFRQYLPQNNLRNILIIIQCTCTCMFILISSITNNWILKIKCHHSVREKNLFSQGILNNCKECFSNKHKLNSGHQIQVHVLYTMRFFDIYVMVFIFNLFDLTLVKLIIEIEKIWVS